MLFIPLLRLHRITAQFKELTIGQAIELTSMPNFQKEAECTAFLRMIIKSVDQGPQDPADWTVQERLMAVCHYLSASNRGNPDFAVGEGKFSDYFALERDYPLDVKTPIRLGTVEGDDWEMRHLTGRMAECIERLEGSFVLPNGKPAPKRLHWMIGAMACQLVLPANNINTEDPKTEGELEEVILNQMKVFAAYPESNFVKLWALFRVGQSKLEHFCKIDFSDEGILVIPKEGTALPSAQFPVSSCITEFALAVGEKL